MENRITTEEAQIFLTEYYKRYDISSEPDDWELLKKYKNFKALTCRDFVLVSPNLSSTVKCIVVFDNRTSSIQVVENESYEYFVKQAANAPVFYYTPVICNDGLVFYFETVAQIDKFGKPAQDNTQYKGMLLNKLNSLFGSKNVYSLSSGLFFSFPLSEMDYVISVLEKNYCKFNVELSTFLDTEVFQPVFPDVDIASHHFPEDLSKTPEEIIDLFLFICCNTENWNSREYSHIKQLVKSIKDTAEFQACLKIINDWPCYQDNKVREIIDAEIIRRRNMALVQDIWRKKQPFSQPGFIPTSAKQEESYNFKSIGEEIPKDELNLPSPVIMTFETSEDENKIPVTQKDFSHTIEKNKD